MVNTLGGFAHGHALGYRIGGVEKKREEGGQGPSKALSRFPSFQSGWVGSSRLDALIDPFAWRWLFLIDASDLLLAKIDVPQPILGRWSQGNRQAAEGAADVVELIGVGDLSFAFYFFDDVARTVFDGGQLCGQRARAGGVELGGRFQADGLVRTFVVVNRAPLGKGALALVQIAPVLPAKQFRFECAVEAFFLALGLRVDGPTMKQLHAQAHEPNAKLGVSVGAASAAPRRAIVAENAPGQTALFEGATQMAFNGDALFIGARFNQQRVTRMIIHRGQRMTPAFLQSEMTFEIQLPKVVGRSVDEAFERPTLRAKGRVEQTVAAQDFRDGAGGRHARVAQVKQARANFKPAPGRMFAPHFEDLRGDESSGQARLRKRAARTIGQSWRAALRVAGDPLVGGARREMKASAKLAHVCVGSRSQSHKIKSQRHKITRFPRHDMCLPCLRSGVYLVSGRYRSDTPYQFIARFHCWRFWSLMRIGLLWETSMCSTDA